MKKPLNRWWLVRSRGLPAGSTQEALLQENGYFVLPLLAQDVGKRLDHVLVTVAHTLARRKREQTTVG